MDIVFLDDIPGFEGQYAISEEGYVYSYRNEEFVKPFVNNKGYLLLNLNNKPEKVHRLLAVTYIPNPNKLPLVDHKDTNPLNNSLDNLRWCSFSQNSRNKNKRKNSSSQYKGVSTMKNSLKFRAKIFYEGKHVSLGCFKTEEEAALAYNEKATELFGEFALLNVIEE